MARTDFHVTKPMIEQFAPQLTREFVLKMRAEYRQCRRDYKAITRWCHTIKDTWPPAARAARHIALTHCLQASDTLPTFDLLVGSPLASAWQKKRAAYRRSTDIRMAVGFFLTTEKFDDEGALRFLDHMVPVTWASIHALIVEAKAQQVKAIAAIKAA